MTDAVVVGSGPNGLAAAVTLARAGLGVTVLEADAVPGGGCRTEELTLPGFRHDWGSAVHPMALTSEFFQRFGLGDRVDYITPDISYAHGIRPGQIAVAWRDIERTAAGLGPDGAAWKRVFGGLSTRLESLGKVIGQPLAAPVRHPPTLARLGLSTLSAAIPGLGWRGEEAAALFAGVAAHGVGNPRSLSLSAVGTVLAAHGHGRHGWPVPRGGAGAVTAALVADLEAHGGRIETGVRIERAADLPAAAVTILNTSARDAARIGAGRLPERYLRSLRRFHYGDGVAKVDFALSEPVPWIDQALRESPTVHLGGTAERVAGSEWAVASGRVSEEPYILITQPSLVDPTRAPVGKAVLWAYIHVQAGSEINATEIITEQIERYAPGFRDTILAHQATGARDLEARDPALIGGDIASGRNSLRQILARPTLSFEPWRTPTEGIYLASAAVAPGPGVHARPGYGAAIAALRDLGIAVPELSAR